MTDSSSTLAVQVQRLPGPKRVDRVRKALRGGEIDPAEEAIGPWLDLFRRDTQPALRVLVLEILESHDDTRIDSLLEEALDARGDSVRLEALRQLILRRPDRARSLALDHLEDEAMEVRVLAAQSVYSSDRDRALAALVGAVIAEARGPREMHTLRWVLEFLVEEAVDHAARESIAALRKECDDTEGMIDWALEVLTAASGDVPSARGRENEEHTREESREAGER